MEREGEQVKEGVIKWAKTFGYNMQLDQLVDYVQQKKGLKFKLNYNFKENFNKMMYF